MSTPKQNKELLGKGIRSLLQNIDADLKTTSGSLKTTVVENATGTNRISVDDIEPNPKQPRRDFDEKALQELAESIKYMISFNQLLFQNWLMENIVLLPVKEDGGPPNLPG